MGPPVRLGEHLLDRRVLLLLRPRVLRHGRPDQLRRVLLQGSGDGSTQPLSHPVDTPTVRARSRLLRHAADAHCRDDHRRHGRDQ